MSKCTVLRGECHDARCYTDTPHACHDMACLTKRLRDECARLRDENARLRANLINCSLRLEVYYGKDYPAVRDAKAALTPPEQEGGKR